MSDTDALGTWVRRFLIEHVVIRRNLARTTQLAYRDTLAMMIRYAVAATAKRADLLNVEDISRELVTKCLTCYEREQGCTTRTSNRHLAALHSFARFVGEYSPEHVQWAGTIMTMPFKKFARPQIPYLEKAEMEALLTAPDRRSSQGRRDYALLLFLYNTGARASEVAQVRVVDLRLHDVDRGNAFVTLHGKGQKERLCPLWPHTAHELRQLVVGCPGDHYAFLNRRREPLTRFGIHASVERYARRAVERVPTLAAKRVSPHSIRHTTATHLLRSGVDINTIRAWLGHVSLSTTNMYTEIDLEMKAQALALLEPAGRPHRSKRVAPNLMEFLSNL